MPITESEYYQESQITNGPLVISHAMPDAQSVAIGIFINVGSRDEAEHQAGLSHALEHMLFKGTRALGVHELAEKLDDLGGNANAYTSRDRTCFHLHVLYESWPEALSLLSDMVLNPALPKDEWQREREVIFAEMSMVEDSPEEWVTDQHISALFAGQALARPVLGFHQTLAAMSADDLRSYQEHWYRPPRILVAAAGRIEHQQLVDVIEQRFRSHAWQRNGDHQGRSHGHQHGGLQALEREGEQAQMVVSFPGVSAVSSERPVAWLANQMLGGGMSSQLFREVREKRGLAYNVGSHLSMLQDVGSWSMTCGMDPERGSECVKVMAEVLQEFPLSLTEAEVSRAKNQMEVQLRMGLDSVEGQMLYLGARLDEERLISPEQWVEKIQAIDLDMVKQWAQERLASEALWTIAAPKKLLVSICDQIRDSMRPC